MSDDVQMKKQHEDNKLRALQPGDPIWMPELGDKPGGPYWTFHALIGDTEYCEVRAPNGMISEYPNRYVERAPAESTNHSTTLVVIFLVIVAIAVVILVKM